MKWGILRCAFVRWKVEVGRLCRQLKLGVEVEVSRGAGFLVPMFFVGRGMAKKDPELDPALYVGAVFGAVV